MTTNNPPIAAWAPSTALSKLASRHNNAPCVLTDGPAEFNDVPLIRLADYQRLQAECEELRTALAESRANDLTAMGYLNQIRGLVGAADLPDMVRRCEQLRKDAERIEWLEDQTKKSWTGISFDYHRYAEDGYVVNHGYRFMRRHFASGFKDSLRKAIDAAMQEAAVARSALSAHREQQGGDV